MGSLCIEGLPPALAHLNEVGSDGLVDFVKALSECWSSAAPAERAQLIRSLRTMRVNEPALWDRTAWDALGAVCRTLDGRELAVNCSSSVGPGHAAGVFRLLRIASSVQSFNVSARLLRDVKGETLTPNQVFSRRLESGVRVRMNSEEEQWLAYGSIQSWLTYCDTRKYFPPKFDASEVPSLAIPGARVSQPVFWYTETVYAIAHAPWIYEMASPSKRKRKCPGPRTQWPESKIQGAAVVVSTLPIDTFQKATEVYPRYRDSDSRVPPDLPTREGGMIKFPGNFIRWDLLEAISRAWAFLTESQPKAEPVAVRYRCERAYAVRLEAQHGVKAYSRGWLVGTVGGWGIVRSATLSCEHDWEEIEFNNDFEHTGEQCLMAAQYEIIHLSELHPTPAMLSDRFEALQWAQFSLGEKVLVSTGRDGILLYGNVVAVGEAMSSSRINAASPAGTVCVRVGNDREVVIRNDSCERFICFGAQPGIEGCFLGAPAPSDELTLPRCMVTRESIYTTASEGGLADVIPAGRYLGLIPISAAPNVRRVSRGRESDSHSEEESWSGGGEVEEVAPLRRSTRISAKKASQRICVLSKSLDEDTPESERGSMSRRFPMAETMAESTEEVAWESSPSKRRKLQHEVSPPPPPKLPVPRDLQLKTQLHQALSFLAALGLDLVGSSAQGGQIYQFAAPIRPSCPSKSPTPCVEPLDPTLGVYTRHYKRLHAQYPSQVSALPPSAQSFLVGHKSRHLKNKADKQPGMRTRRQQKGGEGAASNPELGPQGNLESLERLLHSTSSPPPPPPGPVILSGNALETIFRQFCGPPIPASAPQSSAPAPEASALTSMLAEATLAETAPHTQLLTPDTHISMDPFPSYSFRRPVALSNASTTSTDLASSILSSSVPSAFPSSPPPRPSPRHCRHRAAPNESLSVLEVLDLQSRLKQLLEKVGPAAQRCALVAQQLAPLVLNRSMEVNDYLNIVSRPVGAPALCEARRPNPAPPKRRWAPPEPVLAALRKPPRPVPLRPFSPVLTIRPQFPQPAVMKHP